MSSYYFRETGLSRGQDDATTKKSVCTWWHEYFILEDGLLAVVNIFEDGLMYRSPALPFPVPQRARPSTREAYEAALTKCLAKEEVTKAQQAKEKAFKKLLASGNIYGSLEIEPEPSPLEQILAGPGVVQLYPPALLADFTVIDTEFQLNTLLEVAAVRYINWEPTEQLISFVRFDGEINYHVNKLTGITASDVRRAPTAKQVLTELRRVAGDSVLVAHNVSADRRIIELTRTELGAKEPLPNEWLCTMAHARTRYPAPHKLGDLCARFDIPTTGAHRAMNDVQMCYQLLRRMHQEHPITSIQPSSGKAKRTSAKAQPALFANAA